MKFCIVIAGALVLTACASAEQTNAPETIYKVQPGHWTGESVTQYSADEKPKDPYIHDWCLSPDEVRISGSELADALAGFIGDKRGECSVSSMDAKPYRLEFGLSCTIEGVDMTGEGLMSYAEDGATTDMTITVKSVPGQSLVSLSRTAHQKRLGDICPPGVD